MPETDPAAPLVVLVHGLEGHTKRGYMVQTYLALATRGMRAVGLNLCGCSGEANRAARFYHSGETEDIGFVIGLLRERFPARPLMAIGFSLGANVLLKFLGEQGAKNAAPVSAAVAISVPYDLSAGAAALDRGAMARIYSGYFLRSLTAKVRAKKEILANVLDLDAVWASATLREFDEVATAKLHGFAGAEDYYRKSSSNRFVHSVRVPTLLPSLPGRSLSAPGGPAPFRHRGESILDPGPYRSRRPCRLFRGRTTLESGLLDGGAKCVFPCPPSSGHPSHDRRRAPPRGRMG